jgi:hypothetical protein
VTDPRPTEYLAECLWPGVRNVDLTAFDARAREAAGGQVRHVGSMLMPEDEVVFFVFHGPSAEAVRAVAERAELPFERIVESIGAAALTTEGES